MIEQMSTNAKTLITAEERRRREAAVSYARASVGLEGFEISEKAEHDVQRFIDGALELDEIVGRRE